MNTNTTEIEKQELAQQNIVIAEANDFAKKFLGKVGTIPFGQNVIKVRLVEVQVRKTASNIYVMGLYETDSTMPKDVSPYEENIKYLHDKSDDIGMFPESIPSRLEPETTYVEASKWQWEPHELVTLLFKQAWQKNLTKKDVIDFITSVVGNITLTEVRSLSDNDGLYLLDLRAEANKKGKSIEYSYARKGEFPSSRSTTTTISYTTYNRDGDADGGGTFADYINEQWTLQ
jgi:hypothetical protein